MPLTLVGNEIPVNKTTEGDQDNSAIAIYDDGSFIVAWEGDGSGKPIFGNPDDIDDPDYIDDIDVYVQRFDPSGQPVGDEVIIEDVLDFGADYNPAIATTPDGGFVITRTLDSIVSRESVLFSIYDKENQPQNSNFIKEGSPFNDSDIAVRDDGSFVVVWTDNSEGTIGNDVFARLYDKQGIPITSDFRVNILRAGNQEVPKVAVAANGEFVITWQSNAGDDASSIYARHFHPNGNPKTFQEFLVNTPAENVIGQAEPAIAMNDAGEYVISWHQQIEGDSINEIDIYARQFNANDIPFSKDFLVNEFTLNAQYNSDIAIAQDGSFIVTWESSEQNRSSDEIYARRFNPNGFPNGRELHINEFIPNKQEEPKVAMSERGKIAIVWESFDQDGSDDDIFARRIKVVADNSGDNPGNENSGDSKPGHLIIRGTNRKDRLTGTNASETLIGMGKSDTIRAKGGDDILMGVNPNSRRPGKNERDKLIGNGGNDLYVLGNEDSVFYNDGRRKSAGLKDYALIKGFNKRQDTIQLHGKARDYILGNSPRGKGVGLFLDSKEDELIAVIRGKTNNLRLNSNAFEFV